MQLTLDGRDSRNRIQALGDQAVRINDTVYERSVVVSARAVHDNWPVTRVADLCDEHWQALLEVAPEVVILGTGDRIEFPEPRQIATLTNARIGVEVMDSAAACRTFNVLLSEGRAVAVALILGG